MESKHHISDGFSSDLDKASSEQEQIDSLLEEIKRKQINLIEHDILLSAVKAAASDPTLEESVRDTVNRVLVHDAFVSNGSPENFFCESTITKNAAAQLSYDESVALKDIVEKAVEEMYHDIEDKFKGLKVVPTDTKFNAHDEKIKFMLECATALKKAAKLESEKLELFNSLIEVHLKALEGLKDCAHLTTMKNRMLGLKSKMLAVSMQRDMLLREDRDLPKALVKLATFWKQESEKSNAAVQKAEQDLKEYGRLEKDAAYKMLLTEYQNVLQQTKYLENALGKL